MKVNRLQPIPYEPESTLCTQCRQPYRNYSHPLWHTEGELLCETCLDELYFKDLKRIFEENPKWYKHISEDIYTLMLSVIYDKTNDRQNEYIFEQEYEAICNLLEKYLPNDGEETC